MDYTLYKWVYNPEKDDCDFVKVKSYDNPGDAIGDLFKLDINEDVPLAEVWQEGDEDTRIAYRDTLYFDIVLDGRSA